MHRRWNYGEFEVPPEVYELFGNAQKKGAAAEEEWKGAFAAYKDKYPEVRMLSGLMLSVFLASAQGNNDLSVHSQLYALQWTLHSASACCVGFVRLPHVPLLWEGVC